MTWPYFCPHLQIRRMPVAQLQDMGDLSRIHPKIPEYPDAPPTSSIHRIISTINLVERSAACRLAAFDSTNIHFTVCSIIQIGVQLKRRRITASISHSRRASGANGCMQCWAAVLCGSNVFAAITDTRCYKYRRTRLQY